MARWLIRRLSASVEGLDNRERKRMFSPVVKLALFTSFVVGVAVTPAVAIEEPNYSVVTSLDNDVEIRRYDPMIQAVVKLADSRHTSQGFRRLAGFIFGGNETGQEIAMTAPVQETLFVDQPTMAFTMPSQMQLDSLPRPNDDGISIEPVASRTTAVIRFSGWATSTKVEKMTAKLQTVLQRNNVAVRGPALLNQYNPPWTLPFKRRNEIQFDVEWPETGSVGQDASGKRSPVRSI
jgi:hypothetical protein